MNRSAKAAGVGLILALCCPAEVRCVEYPDLPGLGRGSLPPWHPRVAYDRGFPTYAPDLPPATFQLIPATWDAQAMLIPTRWDAKIVLLGTGSVQWPAGWHHRASQGFVTRGAPNTPTEDGGFGLPL